MTVREDDVLFPNNHKGIYGVVEKDDFVLIVPFDGIHFILVKQYRYPIKQYSWEFPQGKHEDGSHIDPEKLAKLELKEETGVTAKSIKKIGFFHEAPGYANQGFSLFLAQGLDFKKQALEDTEDIQYGKFTVTQFENMILNSEITDAPTISAFGLLKVKKII